MPDWVTFVRSRLPLTGLRETRADTDPGQQLPTEQPIDFIIVRHQNIEPGQTFARI